MAAPLQVIDEEQEFNQQLAPSLDSFGVGFGYHVVAVFGAQSSGKSTKQMYIFYRGTLLNSLFQTTFDVMDDHLRRQTTRGIWIALVKEKEPLLILDVEGTDGRERGENQDFERKSALFSLAIAEVVLVNMWEHNVGLYQGANLALLKTVFEVHLQLFEKQEHRTLLLFVIRDYLGTTPVENLEQTLLTDLEKVWNSLNSSYQMKDFFDVSLKTLPHKKLKQEEFDAQVGEFKSWFLDKNYSKFVFKDEYMRKIPADGFAPYAKGIWDLVKANKDLDLPTQQELLAQYRCDEISANVISLFESTLEKAKPEEWEPLRQHHLNLFDQDAHRYRQNVYMKQKHSLTEKMNSIVFVLYSDYVKGLVKKAKHDYLNSFNHVNGLFIEHSKLELSRILDECNNLAVKVQMSGTEWKFDKTELESELNDVRDAKVKEEIDRARAAIQKSCRTKIVTSCSNLFDKLDESDFDALLKVVIDSAASLNSKLMDIDDREHILKSAENQFKSVVWGWLETKFQEELNLKSIVARSRRSFERTFRYGSDGLARVWRSTEEIDQVFSTAKGKANSTLSSLFNFSLPKSFQDYFSSDFIPHIESLRDACQDQLSREMDSLFLEAKRSLIRSSQSVPPWMYLLLVILGWNEFMAIISSPFYFSLLLLAVTMAIWVKVNGGWDQIELLVFFLLRKFWTQIGNNKQD